MYFSCNKFYSDKYYKYRKECDVFDKLNVDVKNDTIFVLEMHGDMSSDHLFSSLWNGSGLVSYEFHGGFLTCNNNPMFGKYIIELVSKWDIEKIRIEEKINSNMIPVTMVYATRIIIENKKYKIDCFKFKDFFNLERDGMDFIE